MYCTRFSCTLASSICKARQEKAKKQSDASESFCESLIFCFNCPQGDNLRIEDDLDVEDLKRHTKKMLLARKDYSMFKLKRKELRKYSKRKRLKRKDRKHGVLKKH